MTTTMQSRCPECGAAVPATDTCQNNFNALLVRESEIGQLNPYFFSTSLGKTTHFFAVSCYAIQHPCSMGYTVAALLAAKENLSLHLSGTASIAAIRISVRKVADGKQRVLRRSGEPIHNWGVEFWPYTVENVLAAPLEGYGEATTHWAQATLEAIRNAETL